NADSLPLCESILKEGGLMLINSSLVREDPKRADIRPVKLEAQAIAERIGNARIANMVALGALARLTGALAIGGIEGILENFFAPDKHKYIPLNAEAIRAGYDAV
ncbi:MAG: 2-oxoacid:acceptor oxidoreductase family protein, partial [Treponema sp.]|nr:2-oxoacid:acceptor oxidoreductase family protein [Treponema sp.]